MKRELHSRFNQTCARYNIGTCFVLLFILISITCCQSPPDPEKPNVIIVMTDDQGIGDLSAHGNPYLKTPNLDAFYAESVSLTDFHVSPLCTPTRSAIVTGKYPIRNGAWATFKGRDSFVKNAPTIAEIFKSNGYSTGLFGKWHLGDNYPVRPTDCGFDHAVHHSAGGVGELSDYWGTNYFDDVYLVNNQPTQFSGFCTDVWFDEAIKYIEQVKENPFFIYLPTNAPHAPLIVEDKYSAPYQELENTKIQSAAYLGMIANIDENFGRLDRYLKKSGISENTILIFLSDNGTQFGYDGKNNLGYNMGYRDNKSDKEEGGHRVPFLLRWPAAGIHFKRDINLLTAHVDIIPTLAGLCNLEFTDHADLDGIDFSSSILDQDFEKPERTVFIHHRQDWRAPDDVLGSCIMKDQWRLIDGNQLYDVEKDPMQTTNLVSMHKAVAADLLNSNAKFIEKTKALEAYKNLPRTIVGSPYQQEVKLTIQHAIGEDGGIWKSEHVALGIKNKNNTYAIDFETAGKYKVSCRRWPKECPGPILGIPETNPKGQFEYKQIKPEAARIKISNNTIEQKILVNQLSVDFEIDVKKGPTMLQADFIEDQETYGVYYIYISKQDGG